MPLAGYNTGRDLILVITTPKGNLDVPILEMGAKQEQKKTEVDPINRPPVTVPHIKGHSGSIKVQRNGAQLDSYFAQIEEDYFAGRNILPSVIKEIIREPDGSTSEWQYDNVFLELADAGKYKAEQTVEQTINFTASRKRQIA